MGRAPCCDKMGLKKGPWTPEEDQKLVAYILRYGHGSWRALPKHAGLLRCGKSCRLRWTNYLRPDIKRGQFSLEEEQVIIHLHGILGNKWSAIAAHLPGRTDNEIKNYWNTHLKKRLLQIGIDPVTHKVRSNLNVMDMGLDVKHLVSSTLSHMSQWDLVRMETEARLSTEFSHKSSSSSSGASALGNMVNPHSTGSAGSEAFLRSSKAQVTEPLRRDFGAVSLERATAGSMDLLAFLQDWEASLQQPGHALEDLIQHNSAAAPSCTQGSQIQSFESRPVTALNPSAILLSQLASPLTINITDSKSTPTHLMEHMSPTSTLSSPFGTTTTTQISKEPSSEPLLDQFLQHTSCGLSYQTCVGLAPSQDIKLLCNNGASTLWAQPCLNMDSSSISVRAAEPAAPPHSCSLPATSTSSVTACSPSSPYPAASGLQLPAELLHELQEDELVGIPPSKVTTTTAAAGSWSSEEYQTGFESKDYWANILHLVGLPASQQLLCAPSL